MPASETPCTDCFSEHVLSSESGIGQCSALLSGKQRTADGERQTVNGGRTGRKSRSIGDEWEFGTSDVVSPESKAFVHPDVVIHDGLPTESARALSSAVAHLVALRRIVEQFDDRLGEPCRIARLD